MILSDLPSTLAWFHVVGVLGDRVGRLFFCVLATRVVVGEDCCDWCCVDGGGLL